MTISQGYLKHNSDNAENAHSRSYVLKPETSGTALRCVNPNMGLWPI